MSDVRKIRKMIEDVASRGKSPEEAVGNWKEGFGDYGEGQDYKDLSEAQKYNMMITVLAFHGLNGEIQDEGWKEAVEDAMDEAGYGSVPWGDKDVEAELDNMYAELSEVAGNAMYEFARKKEGGGASTSG